MSTRQNTGYRDTKSNGASKLERTVSNQQRPALASIHPNTRLTVSMVRLTRSKSDFSFGESVEVGRKRKRTASSSMRALPKRQKKERKPIQPQPALESPESSSEYSDEDGADDGPEEDSSDEFLLNQAPKWQLHRLRKELLIRLFEMAGLDGDAESLNKKALVHQIMLTRRSHSLLRSPSVSSSNDAGAEEEEDSDAKFVAPSRKRPRVVQRTSGSMPLHSRPKAFPTTRSISLGNLGDKLPRRAGERSKKSSTTSDQRSRSSPSESPLALEPSPRKTRARAKQTVNRKRVVERFPVASDTELDSDARSEGESSSGQPIRTSPRHLRRRPMNDEEPHSPHRSRPTRKTRFKGSLRESSTEATEESDAAVAENERNEDSDASEESSLASRTTRLYEDDEVDELEDDDDGNEEIEVVPQVGKQALKQARSASRARLAPPPPGKRAVRARPAQTHTPPSDDDGSLSSEPESEPKVLRNGKIIGEGSTSDEEVEDEIMDVDEEIDQLDESEDVGSEDSDDEEVYEEQDPVEDDTEADVDLSGENLKSLLRHKRDFLVQLCEANDIEADGTKNQLAQALLEWRDSNTNYPSSPTTIPSSASTERPPSTRKPVQRRKGSKHITPVLIRDGPHVHVSSHPQTPPVSRRSKGKENDDIELDLGSLGLVDKEIPPDAIVKLDKIGSGGFKDVYIGKFRNRKVAIAEFRDTLSAMDIKELKLLREFDHPNVVHFLGVSIPEDTRVTPVMIISELCPNGDLFDYIRNVPSPGLRRVLNLMLDIARGLEYLHLRTPSVIHRDCKSSNILITQRITAKITDFGLAKVKQSTRSMVKSLVGTVNWQAPELWHAHPKYDHKVDVFSCAMVFWEMLQWNQPRKSYPWEGMNEHAIYEHVGAKKQRPSMSGMRKQWCPEIVALVERMWHHDPHQRPTMSEVVRDLEKLLRSY